MIIVFNYKINISFARGHFEIMLKGRLGRCSVAVNYGTISGLNLIILLVLANRSASYPKQSHSGT